MGQQESTYRKFDDKSRRKVKLVNKEENNNKENTEEKSEKKRKEKNFSLLSFSWRSGMSNVNTGEDMESWPGWYHGWCNRGQVEKLLSGGPNGLYLVKNSTEFAGDLTLCLQFEGSVLYYRVRSHQGGRFTVDNDQTFSSIDDLVEYYKKEEGSLPCKLFLAAPREVVIEDNNTSNNKSDKKLGKYSAKRRRKNIDIEEILIVNRES